MTRTPKEKSPLQELAEKADGALALCWERLRAKDLRPKDIETMVEAWRVKRRAHLEAAEAKQEKKEDHERQTKYREGSGHD